MCRSRKYPYPPQGRLKKILRGRGVSKGQFLKESMMLNWNFWRGGRGGFRLRKPSIQVSNIQLMSRKAFLAKISRVNGSS